MIFPNCAPKAWSRSCHAPAAIACQPRVTSVCLIFLKLFDRVYAPLTAGLLQPVAADAALLQHKRSSLDRLYQRITNALDRLLQALGLTFSPSINGNKILVDAPI